MKILEEIPADFIRNRVYKFIADGDSDIDE